ARLEGCPVVDLVFPLALEPVADRVASAEIAGVDVAAYPQRVLLAETSFRGGPQAPGQEVAVLVAEDDVWNHLLVAGILLDLRARHEERALPDNFLAALQALVDEAVPG